MSQSEPQRYIRLANPSSPGLCFSINLKEKFARASLFEIAISTMHYVSSVFAAAAACLLVSSMAVPVASSTAAVSSNYYWNGTTFHHIVEKR